MASSILSIISNTKILSQVRPLKLLQLRIRKDKGAKSNPELAYSHQMQFSFMTWTSFWSWASYPSASLGSPCGISVKEVICGLLVSELKLQSRYYIHFQIIIPGKVTTTLAVSLLFYEDDFGIK